MVFSRHAVLLAALMGTRGSAVNQGAAIANDAEVPYAVGYLMKLDEAADGGTQYKTCKNTDDEAITSFCGGGLISEGVFLTAAHCFEEAKQKASDGTLDLAGLRVGLGARYPYRNEDGTCSGELRGPAEGVYKIKAVFVHKAMKTISVPYEYKNFKTGKTVKSAGPLGLDHMDVAVVFLDDCTTNVSASTPRFGKIAGLKFPQLQLMWGHFDSKTNQEGLPGSYWGYGESEDDRLFPAYSIDGKYAPKPVKRGNWNFNRGTSLPSVASEKQRKVWANCDWLPDDTAVWDSAKHTTDEAYASDFWFDVAGNRIQNLKASPMIACTPRNPNDESVKSRCVDQAAEADCTKKKSETGKTFCSWVSNECQINEDTVGGIGLVQYPSSGGGDSGSAMWYVENDNKLTLNDRDALQLVHIGIVFAAAEHFPRWDQIIRTDYLQNWLANVLDRDTCAKSATTAYFSGFDAAPGGSAEKPPVTQTGWGLDTHYVGTVKGVTGAVGLSKLKKRAGAGSWTLATVPAAMGSGCYSDCGAPFTDKTDECKASDSDHAGCWKNGICCGSETDCCEWTPGGIVLLIVLIVVGIASIAACAWCCCCKGGSGCCCKKGTHVQAV